MLISLWKLPSSLKPVFFFSCITYDMKRTSSHVLVSCPTLYFECREISQSSFGVNFFANIISSGTSPAFCHNHFPRLLIRWPPLSSSGQTSEVPQTASTSPCWAISPITPCAFNANITSGVTCCFFAECLSLLADSLFWSLTPMKCYMGLSLGDEEATQPHALLSLCGQHTDAQGPVLDSEEGTWWVIVGEKGGCIWFSHSASWVEELAVKFIFHSTRHSYYIMVAQNWIMLLGDWCSLTKTW